jgi:hypothetical protein
MIRADAVLSKVKPGEFDILVLPDLAFSGEDYDISNTGLSFLVLRDIFVFRAYTVFAI